MERFMDVARLQASRFSECPTTKVACLLLTPEPYVIFSTGWNQMPRGISCETWEENMVVHAETSALYNAARIGARTEGATAVVTLFPCLECAKALIQSGVKTVVTEYPNFTHPRWGQQFRMSKDLLERSDVKIIYCDV